MASPMHRADDRRAEERAALREEAYRLIRSRMPLGAIGFVVALAAAWPIERNAHPGRDLAYVAYLAAEILVWVIAIASLSRWSPWGLSPRKVAAMTTIALMALIAGYHVAVGGEGEAVAMMLNLCVIASMLIFPWGAMGQLGVAGAALAIHGIATTLGGVRLIVPEYEVATHLFALGGVSVVGAAFLDRHRWRAHALLRARQEAERADRVKSNLVATVSHDLRSPAAAILGLSEIALDEGTFASQREALERVHRVASEMLCLLNDLLDGSKLEAGTLEVRPTAFRPRELVASLDDVFALQAERKGIRYESVVADDVPGLLVGDQARLRQVLANLLANAFKFTDRGAVALRVQLESTTGPMTPRIAFAVEDTGAGIAPADQERIFEPFEQLRPDAGGGAGLGLAISSRLVERMGGAIELDSEPGRGSVFRFALVLPEAPRREVPRDDASRPGSKLAGRADEAAA